MGKTIFKEVIITILLLIAIVLIMMVIFYDYNPINKIVPEVEPYKTSEEIKNELDAQETIEKTYSLDSADLSKYKNSDLYVQGKANPFASSNTVTNNQVNNSTITNKVTNTNSNSTGTFFNNTGTK